MMHLSGYIKHFLIRVVGVSIACCVSLSVVSAAEFTVSISTGSTSAPFLSTGYLADGWFEATAFDDSCIEGLYGLFTSAVENSAPDGTTPPSPLPITRWRSSGVTKYFGNLGVGRYRLQTTILSGGGVCTVGDMLETLIAIDEYISPAEEPDEGTGDTDTGTGDTDIGTGDAETGSGDTDTGTGESDPVPVRAGSISSVTVRSDAPGQETNESQDHQAGFQTQSVPLIDPCNPRRELLIRAYILFNTEKSYPALSVSDKIRAHLVFDTFMSRVSLSGQKQHAIQDIICPLQAYQQRFTANDTFFHLIEYISDILARNFDPFA